MTRLEYAPEQKPVRKKRAPNKPYLAKLGRCGARLVAKALSDSERMTEYRADKERPSRKSP